MNSFWAGLRYRNMLLVWIPIFAIFLNFFSLNSIANAEQVNEKNCSKYGGSYNAVGCMVNTDGIGGSQKLITDTKQLERFYVLKANNDKYKDFKCPSGYEKVQQPDNTVCNRKDSSADKKEKEIQSKNTIDDIINAYKNRDEYNEAGQTGLTDKDWIDIRDKCKDKKGQELNNCVNENALAKVENKKKEQSGDRSSCRIDGVGWIVCPTVNFLARIVMESYEYIADHFLEIKSNELFTDNSKKDNSGKKLLETWSNFRDLANILFVILFTIVIISQITNIGISSYEIKKMLPRLLIFAILINVSYYISVIAVDVSNILGRGVYNTIVGSIRWSGSSGGTDSLVELTASGLAAGAGVAGIAGGAVFFGGTMFLALVSAAIGVIVMIVTLMIRQAAVIILVVLSPIAFASAILPNTEGIFNKWKSIFKSMLIIYPVASVVVSLSVLASNTLSATSSNPLTRGLYMTLPFVGMAGVITLTKTALATLDKLTNANIAGRISSLAGGANKFAANSSLAKHTANWNKNNRDALTGRNKNPNTSIGRFLGKAGRISRIAGAAGYFRDSRLRAESDARVIEENQKWDDEDRSIAMLEQMEANGTITDSQLRSLNGLRAIKQKREDDQISTQSIAMARSWATLNGDAAKDAAIESFLVGAMQSGDFSKFRVAYGAAKNSGKKESDIANIMSSAIKSSGLSQEFAQKFTDRYAGDMKAVSPSLMGAMTVARNTQGGITTQKLSNGLTMAESVMSQAMSDPGAYANMTAKSLTALRPGETNNYLNAIDNMSQDQLSSVISMANNALTNPETRDDMTADQEKFLNQIIKKANSKIVANPNSNTSSSSKSTPPSNPVPNNNSPTRKVQPNYRGNWINPNSGKKPNNP